MDIFIYGKGVNIKVEDDRNYGPSYRGMKKIRQPLIGGVKNEHLYNN